MNLTQAYKRILNKLRRLGVKITEPIWRQVEKDIEFKRQGAKPSEEILEHYKKIREQE